MSTSALFRRTSPLFRAALHRRGAPRTRNYSSSKRQQQSQQDREPFRKRLRTALDGTQIVWRPIPIALGIAFLGAFQLYRTQVLEQQRIDDEWARRNNYDGDGRPPRKHRIAPSGPWTVQIMSTLPLKALSRIWGQFNSLDIPYYLRVPGFKLYGWVFGVNFNEIEEPDLHKFRNLAEFFYRTLKPGVRPLDPNPNALLSPADGKIVQFGVIENGDVEQVKGVTYSVDALLGDQPTLGEKPTSNVGGTDGAPKQSQFRIREGDEEKIQADEEFARVNGISYDLPSLFSGSAQANKAKPRTREGAKLNEIVVSAEDQSTPSRASSEAAVQADLALSPKANKPWYYFGGQAEAPTALYYCVVYLAPGDYHRFHSPVSWVVEQRRHFAGELYSVSPYLVRTLPGLFTLNERVVLLGKWKHGFFSYTPVGATNVGSIVVNFDRELRTNSLLTDTQADHAADEAKKRGETYSGYAEATYKTASNVLGGHALKRGEEMGGFQLGSTIVMVFEAPKGRRPTLDEGYMGADGSGRKGGWKWCIEKGMQVKVGEKLGFAVEEHDLHIVDVLHVRDIATGWFSPTGKDAIRAAESLKAVVEIAVKDATTTTWARTREQIDGGQFPGPRKLSTWEETKTFLSRYVLVAKKIQSVMEELDELFGSILGAKADEVAADYALRHNYTKMLPEDIVKRYNIPTVRRKDLIDLIKAEKSGSTRVPPSAAPKKDQELLKGLGKVVANYQQLGRDISKRLVASLPDADKTLAHTLYTLVTCSERGVSEQYPEMRSCRAFEIIASTVSKSGWKMNDEVAGLFVAAIMGHRELRNWYDHLPGDDERFDHNDQHEHFLQTLIKVAKDLLGLPPSF